jgi:hypothetical protein
MRVARLLEYLKECNTDDEVVIQTIDLDTGDEIDLYPFYVDEVKVTNTLSEIRLVQKNNTLENFKQEYNG